MFKESLEDLKDRYIDRFNLTFILSREQQEIELLNGRITGEKAARLLETWVRPETVTDAFVCGPGSMLDEVVDALREHGVAPERIRVERFVPGPATARRRAAAVPDEHSGTVEVTAIVDGHAHRFTLRKDAEPILEAALRQGIALPYSCKGGICSTCRAKLVEGEVDMDTCFALEEYEVRQGYVLCCQSYPVTDRVTVDFDRL
jgi:ring-1,2-phenylacetyl-CoA epoxidase subunit PaaE